MWAIGYIIGMVWGAAMVACLSTLDLRPGMIVFLVVAATGLGLAVVALLSAWAEREGK